MTNSIFYNIKNKYYQNIRKNNIQLVTIKSKLTQRNTSHQTLSATYNMFRDPISITENTTVNFDYNYNNQRSRVTYANSAKTKYYSEGMQVEVIKNNNDYKFITYIDGDPYSANIMYVKTQSSSGYYFLHRDNQGTILGISDSSGTMIEQRIFDPWGNLKQGSISFIERGYTGHEHFLEISLIHMNARLYDPVKKMFLTPDNVLQDPYNPLNYNRFGYCLNNPLKYNDPSGNFIPFFIIPSFSIDNNGSIGFSLSFVLGIPHALNVSATIGYAGGQGYITAGVQGGGAYAYIGYGGQSGWMAGVGFSFLPPGAAGNFSVGTNIGSVGLSWSEFGGVSASAFGLSISSRGVDFNPSISISHSFWANEPKAVRQLTQESLVEDQLPSKGQIVVASDVEYSDAFVQKLIEAYKEAYGKNIKFKDLIQSINSKLPEGYTNDENGHVFNGKGEEIRGVTTFDYNSKSNEVVQNTLKIYIFKIAFTSKTGLLRTIGHEFYHAALTKFRPEIFNLTNITGYKKIDIIEHLYIYEWERAQFNYIRNDVLLNTQYDWYKTNWGSIPSSYKLPNTFNYINMGFKLINLN